VAHDLDLDANEWALETSNREVVHIPLPTCACNCYLCFVISREMDVVVQSVASKFGDFALHAHIQE
jgi:hypothetical protein